MWLLKAVKSLISGYNFGIGVVTSGEGLKIGPNFPSTFYLLPRQVDSSYWGVVIQTTQNNSFTSQQFGLVMDEVGLPDGAAKVAYAEQTWNDDDPMVADLMVVGSKGLPTERGFVYNADAWTDGPVKTLYDSGDGTVPFASVMYGTKWSNSSLVTFENLDHVGILSDPGFLKWLLTTLSAANVHKK